MTTVGFIGLIDSTSNDRRTRLSWRSQKKHVLQTFDTYLSKLTSVAKKHHQSVLSYHNHATT